MGVQKARDRRKRRAARAAQQRRQKRAEYSQRRRACFIPWKVARYQPKYDDEPQAFDWLRELYARRRKAELQRKLAAREKLQRKDAAIGKENSTNGL